MMTIGRRECNVCRHTDLPSTVLSGGILGGKQSESGVRPDHFLCLGDHQLSVVIQNLEVKKLQGACVLYIYMWQGPCIICMWEIRIYLYLKTSGNTRFVNNALSKSVHTII